MHYSSIPKQSKILCKFFHGKDVIIIYTHAISSKYAFGYTIQLHNLTNDSAFVFEESRYNLKDLYVYPTERIAIERSLNNMSIYYIHFFNSGNPPEILKKFHSWKLAYELKHKIVVYFK